MNREKILAELAKFEAKNTKKTSDSESGGKNVFWKPKPGENKIRILPNPADPEYPYTELAFYYLGGKTFLAPSQFGNPDPCVEVYNNFMPKDKGGAPVKLPLDEWKVLNNARRKFEANKRYFLLVLVRGEESEGPKWWGHTAKVWKDISTNIFANEDWDDVTDLAAGNDVTVIYTEPKTDGEFASTSVVPSPKKKPASDNLETLKTQLGEVPALNTIFKEPTYAELKSTIETVLNIPTSGDEPKTSQGSTTPEKPKQEPLKTDEVKQVESSFADILAGIELPN